MRVVFLGLVWLVWVDVVCSIARRHISIPNDNGSYIKKQVIVCCRPVEYRIQEVGSCALISLCVFPSVLLKTKFLLYMTES